MTPNARGALFMMGSMTAFTVNDALMKGLSGLVPLSQAVFLRGCLTTLLMLGLALVLGQVRLHVSRRDRGLIALRTLTEVGTAYFFITALFNMPLANASAIMQALPLTVTLAGAVFLGQAVGWRRWAAIAVGFLGVMLIVRPGMSGVHDLFALRAGGRHPGDDPGYPVAQDLGRGAQPDDRAEQRSLGDGGLWPRLDRRRLGTDDRGQRGPDHRRCRHDHRRLFLRRRGHAPRRYRRTVAPFRYTSLVVAMVLGVIVFAERPDGLTLLGAGIVVATGIYTFYRERARARDEEMQGP